MTDKAATLLGGRTMTCDFLLAQNKARRHITQAQLVACASAVFKWQSVGRPGNPALSAELKVTSQDMAAGGFHAWIPRWIPTG